MPINADSATGSNCPAPDGENAVGFGILGHGEGSYTELWDWEARKLKSSN